MSACMRFIELQPQRASCNFLHMHNAMLFRRSPAPRTSYSGPIKVVYRCQRWLQPPVASRHDSRVRTPR